MISKESSRKTQVQGFRNEFLKNVIYFIKTTHRVRQFLPPAIAMDNSCIPFTRTHAELKERKRCGKATFSLVAFDSEALNVHLTLQDCLFQQERLLI